MSNIEIVQGNEVQSSFRDATFTDLLYLSKFVAQVNEEDKISTNSFVNAFGFIEFNEQAKQTFSQIVELEELGLYEGAQQYIEQVKNTPKILYSEELKGVVNQLEEIFGDNPIGALR